MMNEWMRAVLQAAAEEQLHGVSAIHHRRKCRRGCQRDETAYHVAAACPTRRYIYRHDYIVHWVLKAIMQSLREPKQMVRNIQFGKATCNVTFESGGRKINVEAGIKILTEKRIYHNKPDVVVRLANPQEIIIIEVAVAHIQNWRAQEKLKRTRYEVNSAIHVTEDNVDEISRDVSLVGEIERRYKSPVTLAIFVMGCYGEIIRTDECNVPQNFTHL